MVVEFLGTRSPRTEVLSDLRCARNVRYEISAKSMIRTVSVSGANSKPVSCEARDLNIR